MLASTTSSEDRRDIVFDCPCHAEWVADESGERGTLTLHARLRSLRASESGRLRLLAWLKSDGDRLLRGGWEQGTAALAEGGRLAGPWVFAGVAEPGSLNPPAAIVFFLQEQVGQDAAGAPLLQAHENLALWPVPKNGASEKSRYVDILTDTDGDGVGDVNERLAETAWNDPKSAPGDSEIDVLALYTAEFAEAEAGYPYTRLLHHLNVASLLFEDSDTNVRLRTVGMSEVTLDDDGWAEPALRRELMDAHGADLAVQFSPTGPGGPGIAGRAVVGASRTAYCPDARA